MGGAVELRPDLDQVPALAAERDQLWGRIGAADFLDDDEKRAALGLPPRAGA
jgi:phage portal protein BeeE